MLINPFAPIAFIKITSLKATTFFLLILLIKSNLLRLKGGLIGGLFALILISGILASTSIAVGSLIYAYKVKNKTERKNWNISVEIYFERIEIFLLEPEFSAGPFLWEEKWKLYTQSHEKLPPENILIEIFWLRQKIFKIIEWNQIFNKII